MNLTHRTDYALRVLMYLAARECSRSKANARARATSAEIALAFDVSLNHLVKVVNDLARLGYVCTSRGPGGGLRLARKPDSIALGSFIEHFQGAMRLHDCTVTDGICRIESFCRLKGILAQADRVQKEYLDSYTLADFVPAKAKIAGLPS